MSSTSDNETEILLGNRHLLAIFFVLAVLLGIAFTGGYMVGRNASDKKPATLAAITDPAASTSTGAETHALPPASDSADQAVPSNPPAPADDKTHTVQPPPEVATASPAHEETPLGSPRNQQHAEQSRAAAQPAVATPVARVKADTSVAPQSGQTYLQVAAVGHTEAKALADVLSRKGFHAHAVAKPGTALYRVLVGPMHDAGELSSTRDSLRNAGFTKIFVQRY